MMKRFILLFSAILLLSLLSCTAATNDSVGSNEYYEGKAYGEALAKEEIIKASCFDNYRNPAGFFTQKAHVERLEKKGKSIKFIKSFRWGYKSAYRDMVQLYCGNSAEYTW